MAEPELTATPIDTDDGPQENTDVLAAATTTAPPPPRTAIDWSRTQLTPGLVRALAKAQAEAQTLGKDSRVDAGAQKYNYTNADAMVREASRVLNGNGIAWVCASTQSAPPDFNLGDKMWAVSTVRTESVLLHADDDDRIGMLVLVGETISIGQAGRTPDKADKAGETYLRGFIARDLVALDRAETPKDEDREAHRDENTTAARGRSSQSQSQSQSGSVSSAEASRVKDGIAASLKGIAEAAVMRGEKRPTNPKIIAAVMGPDFAVRSHDDAVRLLQRLEAWLGGEIEVEL